MSLDIKLPRLLNDGPVFFHTDIKRVLHLVDRRKDVNATLDDLLSVCKNLADGRDIWMPVFSYRFTNEGIYDVQNDPSQIGLLSEHFRKTSNWRTNEPVFSICGLENTAKPQMINPDISNKFKAFGSESVFAKLTERKGIIVWFGASLRNSITFVHYAESLFGTPLYRYVKRFKGTIVDNGQNFEVDFEYHVKPKQFRISYDYDIRLAAISKGIINEIPGSNGTCYYSYADELVAYFSEFLDKDLLSLLDETSLKWVNTHLEKLGRGFIQSDFEPHS